MKASQLDFVDELEWQFGKFEIRLKKDFRMAGLVIWIKMLRDVLRDLRAQRSKSYEQLMLAEVELAAKSQDPAVIKALEYIGNAKSLLAVTVIWAASALLASDEGFVKRMGSRGKRVSPVLAVGRIGA